MRPFLVEVEDFSSWMVTKYILLLHEQVKCAKQLLSQQIIYTYLHTYIQMEGTCQGFAIFVNGYTEKFSYIIPVLLMNSGNLTLQSITA